MTPNKRTMLIAFSIQNFRSYRTEQTLSLLASDDDTLLGNTVQVDIPALKGGRLLKSVAIYGGNSSGKSNFIKAFRALCRIVGQSAKESTADEAMPISPFELDETCSTKPTRFSVTFAIDRVLYIYNLELTKERVHLEELLAFPKSHPQTLFRREVLDDGTSTWQFSRAHFKRDAELESRTRKNSLYVSVGTLFNHELLTTISRFFVKVDIREPRFSERELAITQARCVEDIDFRSWAAEILAAADTGIADVRATTVDVFSQMPEEMKKSLPEEVASKIAKQLKEHPDVQVAHRDGNSKLIWWPLARESDGTVQLLSLLRSWFTLLRKGGVAIVDELDASLHALMSRQLLKMIGDARTIESVPQLIFTTHDTALLDPTLLRRDQIFFAEKTADGATQLYSLLEYTPRKDEPFQKGYLSGRYGAIPFLGDFRFEAERKSTGSVLEASSSAADCGESA